MAHTEPTSISFFPVTRRLFVFLQSQLQDVLWLLGLAVEHTWTLVRFIFHGKLNLKHCLTQASFVGWDALGIALIMTTFSGMVIALQVAKEMAKQGAGSYVGSLVSLAILRELAPIMTGFSVIAMVGSAFAAELSTMQITRQVDALRVLHVHPLRYLVLPRVVAGTLMLPLMTILTAFCGIMGGMFISQWMADIHPGAYLESVWYQTELKDILGALLKSTVFGYLTMILSTTIGIQTTGGAKEVGHATTRAVVWSFVAMAVFDYLLTYLIYGSM